MRLFEISFTRFFVATKIEQKPGSRVSVPANSLYPLGAALESRLEFTRPAERLPRASSLYLRPKPPSGGDYVYEVQADGQIDRLHSVWLRKLGEVSLGSTGALDHFCRAYWSGQECPEERDQPWEYRTMVATVLRRAGGDAL